MKLPFLRKMAPEEPLVVSMTGVKLGDRLLYVGAAAALFGPLAARVGLSGQTTVVAQNAETLKAAAERDGLLIDATARVPDDASYDVAVVEARGDWVRALPAISGAVRRGGRLVVVAGEPHTWLGRFRSRAEPPPPDSEIVRSLETSGWSSARSIGRHGDLRFVESVRR